MHFLWRFWASFWRGEGVGVGGFGGWAGCRTQSRNQIISIDSWLRKHGCSPLHCCTGGKLMIVQMSIPIHSTADVIDKYKEVLSQNPNIKLVVLGKWCILECYIDHIYICSGQIDCFYSGVNKNHLIRQCCLRPSIALAVQNRSLKHQSFIHSIPEYHQCDLSDLDLWPLSYWSWFWYLLNIRFIIINCQRLL